MMLGMLWGQVYRTFLFLDDTTFSNITLYSLHTRYLYLVGFDVMLDAPHLSSNVGE